MSEQAEPMNEDITVEAGNDIDGDAAENTVATASAQQFISDDDLNEHEDRIYLKACLDSLLSTIREMSAQAATADIRSRFTEVHDLLDRKQVKLLDKGCKIRKNEEENPSGMPMKILLERFIDGTFVLVVYFITSLEDKNNKRDYKNWLKTASNDILETLGCSGTEM